MIDLDKKIKINQKAFPNRYYEITLFDLLSEFVAFKYLEIADREYIEKNFNQIKDDLIKYINTMDRQTLHLCTSNTLVKLTDESIELILNEIK